MNIFRAHFFAVQSCCVRCREHAHRKVQEQTRRRLLNPTMQCYTTRHSKKMPTLNHTPKPTYSSVWGLFAPGQEPLVQKLIIVPLYIQCETAGGETQCAGSLNLTATVHNVLTFLQRAYKCARSSKLSYLLLYGLLLAQA